MFAGNAHEWWACVVVISTFAKLLSRHIISFSILRTVGGFSAHDHIVGICRWCELLRVLPTRFVLLQFFNQPQKTSNKIFLLRSINNWTGAGTKGRMRCDKQCINSSFSWVPCIIQCTFKSWTRPFEASDVPTDCLFPATGPYKYRLIMKLNV